MSDKARILARRARFLSIALVSCSPAAKPTNVAVVQPVVDAAVPALTSPVNEPVHDAGPPEVGDKAGMSIAIPNGITDETRVRYERLDASVTSIQKEIKEIDLEMSNAPKCPGPACDDFWKEIAGRIDSISGSIGWMSIACPDPK